MNELTQRKSTKMRNQPKPHKDRRALNLDLKMLKRGASKIQGR